MKETYKQKKAQNWGERGTKEGEAVTIMKHL